MSRKKYAIIVAGGSGVRMGSSIPKQFIEVEGISILQRTISRFIEAIPDINIITVLPKAHFSTWKDICVKSEFDCPQILVEGGMTRFHSVKNALEKIPDNAIVAVHDGVRPFISATKIREMMTSAESIPAVIPAIKVVDSLKFKDGSLPEPDRDAIVAVQTPQIFHSEIIKAAYGQAYREEFTDDASVVARYGTPLSFAEGERLNIKVTAPEDLVLAKLICLGNL